MGFETLQIFIPAFMIVFVGTVSLWSHVRKRKRIQLTNSVQASLSRELMLVDIFFKVLLLLSIVIAIVYAYFPEYYYLTGPISWLDNPVVNTIGILVLKVSLIWIVMAQFNIERTIALLNSGITKSSFRKMVAYSQKLILTGMLIMFIGLFITISSIVAIWICLAAIFLYDRIQTKLTYE